MPTGPTGRSEHAPGESLFTGVRGRGVLKRGTRVQKEWVLLRGSPALLLLPLLLLVDRLYRPKSMAFELPATLWTVRQRFGVSLARFEVVEEHPLVLPSSPPQLPPQLVTPFAWTT